jgi:hypothetical protein
LKRPRFLVRSISPLHFRRIFVMLCMPECLPVAFDCDICNASLEWHTSIATAVQQFVADWAEKMRRKCDLKSFSRDNSLVRPLQISFAKYNLNSPVLFDPSC